MGFKAKARGAVFNIKYNNDYNTLENYKDIQLESAKIMQDI